VGFTKEYNSIWQPKCGADSESFSHHLVNERISTTMWKPTNQPATPGRPAEPERPSTPTATTAPLSSISTSEPAAVPRPVTTTTSDQATIGKSLVIKGEVTGSESLYIDGRVEGSINLSGNRVTIGRNGVVSANISAREIVVLGKVRGNLTASDRVDIRSDGSLTGDVVAARISIEDGAFFKGGIDIRKAGSAGAKPEEVTATGTGTKSVSSALAEPAIAARA
jgi:cytoskeletal protein CcmA (bactofilin family)